MIVVRAAVPVKRTARDKRTDKGFGDKGPVLFRKILPLHAVFAI